MCPPVKFRTVSTRIRCASPRFRLTCGATCMDARWAQCCDQCLLQVSPRPQQPNGWDCGIFAALQAEVLCSNLQGCVQKQGDGLICEGPNWNFMADDKDWFTMNDVIAARLLLRAACMAFWVEQCPVQYADMSAEAVQAREDLKKASNQSLPKAEELW